MARITVEGALYYDPDPFAEQHGLGQYRFFKLRPQDALRRFGDYIPVQRHTLTFDLPADFDPRPEQVKQLEAQKHEAMAKFQALITEIDARISKLQAIEYSGEAA